MQLAYSTIVTNADTVKASRPVLSFSVQFRIAVGTGRS